MCGRSSLTKTEKELEERFNASFYSDELIRYNPLPNYNVAPSHMHPVITNHDADHFKFMRWGLIPFWAKDEKIGYKMINARVETVDQKPSFKHALIKRRCIVPFDGFYEWKKNEDGTKQPYRIQVADQEIFSVAGLWEKWTSPKGDDVFSFTLITQAANNFMKKIHDRMPAILSQEEERLWLEEGISTTELLKVIKPFADQRMNAYEVDPRVGNVRNNDADLIKPFKAKQPAKPKSSKNDNRHNLFD